ncbi:SMC family ATPase [Pseudogracilibacillus sp. SE30717A]|uniref:SMC family ATPase n=1 Tax=Pseudogracilibacillus sp. SE30717A TaxID=3098293 RepID=UPI00300E37EF
MKDVRLSKLVIDHFRGYREPKVFDFSKGSDFTVLSGSNGFGKTSFFDAVEWGFTGKLFRFEEPNEEKSKNHFINYQPYELPAKVTIELIEDDKKYIIYREATNFEAKNTDYGSNKSKLILYGPDFEPLYNNDAMNKLNELLIQEDWRDKLDFQNVFSQFHLLTQDKLKYFVQGLKGPDRYNQISSLLGTSRFQKYNKQIDSIRKETNDKIKFIDEKLNKVIPNINLLKDRISNQQSINIDGFTNIKDFIDDIILKYNSNVILKDLSLDEFKVSNELIDEEQLIKLINDLTRKISVAIDKIELSINTLKNEKNNLEEINSKKETYKSNKFDIKNIQKAIPILDEKRNLIYLLEYFDRYKEFSKKQHELTQNLEQKNNLLQGLSKLISENESFTSITKNDLRNLSNILSSKDEFINKLYNLKSLTSEREQFAKSFLPKEESKLSPFIRIVDEAFLELNQIVLRTITVVETILTDKEGLENERKRLDKQNDSLLTIDKKYRDILKISRDHILAVKNHSYNEEIDCPVCGTEFKSDELLNKIDGVLSVEDGEIKSNINRIDEINKNILKLENKIDHFLSMIHTTSDRIKDQISEVLKQAASQLSYNKVNYNNDLQEYNNSIKQFENNRQLHSNYISVIDKIGLSKESEQLLNEIENNISLISKKQLEMNIQIDEGIESTKNRLTSLEENVRKFESKLTSLNIEDIEEDILNKLNLVSGNLNNYGNTKTDMEITLNKLNKLLQSVVNNKDYKEFNRLNSLKNNLENERDNHVKVIERLENIMESSEKVIEEMNSSILKENEYLINNIYKRIYPHPYFTNIKLELGTNNSGNNVLQIKCYREDQSSCEINPTFTFSTAQMNVVAISIFFALALRQQCTRLSTILLDDPVQSMDDINILAFIDILRSISSEEITLTLNKQVIMSTHDEKIFRLMTKKFRFLNTKTFKFLDYNESGPVFD